MAQYVQVDKFENGDIDDFMDHFEICSLANEWSIEKKALMIATCLKGEALEVYKSLENDEREYGNIKAALQKAFKPEDIKFTSLSEFHERRIYPGESPQKYLYELKRLLKRAFPEMIPEAKELLFEQFIRGLPRYVYENIRTSPDVKTTEDAMKRAQLVIRMHEEASLRSSEEVAVVSSRISIDSLQAETASKEVSEKNISQTAINEAVKVITEKLGVTSDEITCTVQRGVGGRSFVEKKKPGYVKCYVCGGRGHYAQICPSSRRATNQPSSHRRITQVRCYNCNQLGHIMRYCTEPATGQSLNSQGPVGRAETRSQSY